MTLRRAVLASLAAAGALLQARCRDAATGPSARTQAESITASSILAQVRALADDSTRGRFTPSPELDKVADYGAGAFRKSGLEPGMLSGYLQSYPVPPVLPDCVSTPRVQAGDGAAAPNVVGILPGADPSLRGEFVLLVAHMDHLGVGAPVGGDSIMNGADDNASGTAGVLELARAFGGLGERPRRSLVFLLVSGEEEGLWGSIYYVTHPAVPLDRTVAAINLDMIGRNAPDWVYVLGAELSSLGTTIQRVADLHPELDLRPVAVAQPLRGSDHVPFAYGGVPVAFFHSGLHPEYHTPLDEDSLVDGDKAARIARLAFYVALDVAGQSSRPAWNPGARPGPALRSAR